MTTRLPNMREWTKEHTDDAVRRSERAEDVNLKVEANAIARHAVKTNKRLSIGALIVSILSLIVAIFF